MVDTQTKTIGEVRRAAYQKEEESGPRKPVSGGDLGYCVLACLHWEGKRREIISSVRNWHDVGGTENGALLIPPPLPAWYCSAVPSFLHPGPRPKNIQTHTGATKVFLEGLVRGIRFFSKQNSRLVAD